MPPAEAKAAWSAWLSEVETRIDRLRKAATATPVRLSHKEIVALAGHWYAGVVQRSESDPGDINGWEAALFQLEPADEDAAYAAHLRGERYEGPTKTLPALVADLDALLEAEGLTVDVATREAILERMHDLYGDLARLMMRRATGDYGADPVAPTLPRWEAPSVVAAAPSSPAEEISVLFDGYVAERQPAPATVKAWKRMIDGLIVFLGHSDARAVTSEDIIRWKDALLAPQGEGKLRSALTVNDNYLAAARAVFGWALDNRRIASNPAAGVKVRIPKKVRLRDPDFTDDEAKTILKAALGEFPATLTAERKLARRWVPWLCAYTGARVNEITQLRGEDVAEVEGVWTIWITPEAGSVKTSIARRVPLHAHLIEQGFLGVVEANGKGPLFYDPALHRGGSDGNPQYKKTGEHLARWVREIGVVDPRVQPNYGWRHRFKTEARRAEIAADVRDAIQGHAARTEGERYGSFPVAVLSKAVERLRRYDVS